MFDIGFGEFAVLGVLALLIFGPERLPQLARQGGQALRQLRALANNARSDLQDGLGPEFRDLDVQDLNPRRFVRKHLWEDDEPGAANGTPAHAGGLNHGERPPFDQDAT